MKNLIISTILFIFWTSFASCYQKPEHVSDAVWEIIEPKLLPEDHPAKSKLDKIFSKPILKNIITLAEAGFDVSASRNPVHTIVATHPNLKGIIVKVLTDMQFEKDEWMYWIRRIQGAELVGEAIESKGYAHFFKVPKKWIYPVPSNTNDPMRRTFIMIAEKMDILPYEKNVKKWKKMSVERMLALLDMFESLGLYDSVYIDNVPFCNDHKMAFVDTEHFLWWPVHYYKLNRRFETNLDVWLQITGQK